MVNTQCGIELKTYYVLRSTLTDGFLLQMTFALAFILPGEVVNSWDEILQILQPWIQQQTKDVQQKIDDLLMYFETTLQTPPDGSLVHCFRFGYLSVFGNGLCT